MKTLYILYIYKSIYTLNEGGEFGKAFLEMYPTELELKV